MTELLWRYRYLLVPLGIVLFLTLLLLRLSNGPQSGGFIYQLR